MLAPCKKNKTWRQVLAQQRWTRAKLNYKPSDAVAGRASMIMALVPNSQLQEHRTVLSCQPDLPSKAVDGRASIMLTMVLDSQLLKRRLIVARCWSAFGCS